MFARYLSKGKGGREGDQSRYSTTCIYVLHTHRERERERERELTTSHPPSCPMVHLPTSLPSTAASSPFPNLAHFPTPLLLLPSFQRPLCFIYLCSSSLFQSIPYHPFRRLSLTPSPHTTLTTHNHQHLRRYNCLRLQNRVIRHFLQYQRCDSLTQITKNKDFTLYPHSLHTHPVHPSIEGGRLERCSAYHGLSLIIIHLLIKSYTKYKYMR